MIKRFFSTSIRQKLLDTSLINSKLYGFNQDSINKSCEMLNLSPACNKIIAPIDIIHEIQIKNYENVLNNIDDADDIIYNIKDGLDIYYKNINEYIDFWSEAMAILAHPYNISTSNQMLFDFCDNLLFKTGDKSLDFKWYIKRKQLSSLIISGELYLLTDKSKDFIITRKYILNSLNNINNLNLMVQNYSDINQSVNNSFWMISDVLKSFIYKK